MFAYCLGDPVNRTDIFGTVSLWYYLIVDHDMGFIHRMVQAHILATSDSDITAELVLPGLGRADIVNTSTGAVWEVKHAGHFPALREATVVAQATSYIGGTHGDTVITGLGNAGAFKGVFLINCLEYTYEVTYYTPTPGVVLYKVKEINDTRNACGYEYSYTYVPQKEKVASHSFSFFFIPIGGGAGGNYVDCGTNGSWANSKYCYY